jgi:hypothetical protein
MLVHFQWKPLYPGTELPGWNISFFFKGAYYTAVYHKEGRIEWTSAEPPEAMREQIISQIHELMLFHVYE